MDISPKWRTRTGKRGQPAAAKDKCLAAIRNAEEDSISFTYDADGNLLTITDFNGAGYLTNTYDQKQRIVKQVVAGRVEYRGL